MTVRQVATVGMIFCLALGGCAYRIPNHANMLTERIDRQELVRDRCLSSYIAGHDDPASDPAELGRLASAACSAEDQKPIELLIRMIRNEDGHVATAVLNESVQRATSMVYRRRAPAGQL